MMNKSTLTLFGWLALAACSDPASDTAEQDAAAGGAAATVFEGARVIVGDGTAPLENASFIVEDGRFVAVGEAGDLEVPDGVTRVDLSGMTVMPAVIDTHTHLSVERDALVEDLRRRARFGVGAALSLGADGTDAPIEVSEETIPGAALYRTAGRGITAPEPGRNDVPHWVTSEEEARAAVREEAARGVDIIKIWVDDRNGMYEKLSPALYTAIIDEAHANDLRVTAHIFALEDAKGLLRAGVDAFAHGIRDTDVDDEIVALFRERPDVVLVPNLPEPGTARNLDWLRDQVSDEQWQQLQANAVARPDAQAAFEIQARNLERLSREGVKIALGTDGNSPWGPHLEMADMVASGMSPHDVIVAATQRSAEFLELADTGTIEAGNSADFVVLEANPLDDIANTRRIDAVYLRGEAVDR